ncbi:MAG TPA: hypothetical protein VK607_00635, partial [Kofleriaceae bacterium]|nr:hypothetical protein [Kofleriaceae bacterium]
MRLLFIAVTALALAPACRNTPDEHGQLADAAPADSPGTGSDGPGGGSDAPGTTDGIAAARAHADGAGLALAIHGATITYQKPQIGNPSNDPAGFTIQAARLGPALFVAVDPATLSPAPAVGDVVDFTISSKTTVSGEPRAAAITG